MSDLVVIGVDGGKSTGIAEYQAQHSEPTITWRYQGDRHRAMDALRGRLDLFRQANVVDVIITCEMFIPKGRGVRTWEPDALKVCGAVEEMCARHRFRYLELGPSYTKKIAGDNRLRRLGWWTLPGEVMQPDANDVNDALRIVLATLAGHHTVEFGRVMGPIRLRSS